MIAVACTGWLVLAPALAFGSPPQSAVTPTPVPYSCSGGDGTPLSATFHPHSEPARAVLRYGEKEAVVFATPAASGAKYTSADVSFWEHHGEAKVNWFGTALECRPAEGPAAAQEQARPFVGTTWVLVEFKSMDDTTLRPEARGRYSLAFGSDGTVLVQADCNRGRGTWKSAGDGSLELGPVALTRAACPPSPLEARFARDLGYVRSYVLRDGRLYLSLQADGGIYEFEPAESRR